MNREAGGGLNYRPEIDGLRAIAVTVVILFHAHFSAFSGGYTGVDIFYVISGYLITGIIARDDDNRRFSIVRFYRRRAQRILPALAVLFLLCIPPALLVPDSQWLHDFGSSLIASILFSANIYYWRALGDYFTVASDYQPFLHLWSLAVEEQFYLIFPWFFLAVLKVVKPRWTGAALLGMTLTLLGVSIAGSYFFRHANYFLAFGRAWELLAGALVAQHHRGGYDRPEKSVAWRGALSSFGFILLLIPVFAYDETTRFPGVYAIPTVAGTAMILAFAPRSRFATWLGAPPLRAIGLISYSAYLWHQPLLAYARLLTLDSLTVSQTLGLIVLAFLLGAISWRWVETPFRHPSRISGRSFITMMVVAFAVSMAGGVMLRRITAIPAWFAPDVRTLMNAKASETKDMMGCLLPIDGIAKDRKDCVRGTGAAETLAIVGDSHAVAIAPAFDRWLDVHHQRALILANPSCPPVIDAPDLSEPWAGCAARTKRVLDELERRTDIRIVVVQARWSLYFEQKYFDNRIGGVEAARELKAPTTAERRAVAHGIDTFVRHLIEAGKKVILSYPIPSVGWDVPTRLTKLEMRGLPWHDMLTTEKSVFVQANRSSWAILDTIGPAGVTRFYPSARLCPAGSTRCVFAAGGVPLYLDDDHLSLAGAHLLQGDASSAMDAVRKTGRQ